MTSRNSASAQSLLQEQLRQKSISRQINSPHAKYNSRGQLMCIVCGCSVKSAIVWQAHISKKSHIENLDGLQRKQKELNSIHAIALKRKATNATTHSPPAKKSAINSTDSVKPKGILKTFKSYESSDSEDEVKPSPTASSQDLDDASGTCLDTTQSVKDEIKDEEEAMSDEDVPAATVEEDPARYYLTSADKTKPVAVNKDTENLPEGFFDDPIADAKARKVEYVDKDEAEWNAFMKEVSAAETTSRQIIADDTEEAAKRNQIQQAEEQMQLYQRVLQFDSAVRTRQQQVTPDPNRPSECKAEQPDDSDDTDDDDLSALNWRNKSCCM